MKKKLFFLSFILITSNLLAVGNKYFDLSTSIVDFLYSQKICKELAQEEAKKNYINFLTHLRKEPSTFKKVQDTYAKQDFPAFRKIADIINENFGWSLIEELKLTQERIELLDSAKALSPQEFEKRNSVYLQKFADRSAALESAKFNIIFNKTVKQASKRMLNVIEETKFFVLGDEAIGLTTGQSLKENGLMDAILRHNNNMPTP